MAIIASYSSSGNDFEIVPAGTHAARCYSVIHIGTVKSEFNGESISQDKVRIAFELPTEMRVFNGKEKPMSISASYTLSLSPKSRLRPMLESWRGKKFSEEELAGFDISKLVGAACMLNVIHVEGKKNTFANIAGIIPVIKGMEVDKLFNEPFIFDYEENFSLEKIEGMPDFIKGDIKSSNEYAQKVGKSTDGDSVTPGTDTEVDDLPF